MTSVPAAPVRVNARLDTPRSTARTTDRGAR